MTSAPNGAPAQSISTHATIDFGGLAGAVRLHSCPAAVPQLAFLQLTPAGSNLFRVFLSREPVHQSVLGPTDALNRLNWSLSVLSGFATIPVIEQVENAQPQATLSVSTPGAWSIDLRVDRPILLLAIYQVVANPNLLAADGSQLAASPSDRASAPGIMPPISRVPVKPQTTLQGVDLRYDTFAGTFVLDAKTDIDVQMGLDAVKKRVIRRLISTPGGFYHLRDYGVGLRNKEVYRTTQLSTLQTRVKQQVLQESEILDAKVQVSLVAQNTLVVSLTAKTQTGAGFEMQVTAPQSGPIRVV
ncbi:MAG: hypothetical protein EPN91_09025 [Salinibacterium sp.]|nr:MAG: hypothetical protein EPN91_09025 [Salinibacterium sp.]